MMTGTMAGAGGRTGRAVARVLLLLFALQAAIPAGFMPDVAALRDGSFEIVICTPGGSKILSVDSDGNPVERDGSDRSPLSDCEFRLVVAQAALNPSAPVLEVRPVIRVESAFSRADRRSTEHNHGPPLGSRAPPTLLG